MRANLGLCFDGLVTQVGKRNNLEARNTLGADRSISRNRGRHRLTYTVTFGWPREGLRHADNGQSGTRNPRAAFLGPQVALFCPAMGRRVVSPRRKGSADFGENVRRPGSYTRRQVYDFLIQRQARRAMGPDAPGGPSLSRSAMVARRCDTGVCPSRAQGGSAPTVRPSRTPAPGRP